MKLFSFLLALVVSSQAYALRFNCRGYGYWGAESDLQFQLNADASDRLGLRDVEIYFDFVGSGTRARLSTRFAPALPSNFDSNYPGYQRFVVSPPDAWYEGDSRIHGETVTLVLPPNFRDAGYFSALMQESRAPLNQGRRMRCSYAY